MALNIGIIGNGFVGKATSLFANTFVKAITYDIDPDKCAPHGTTLHDIISCDLVFVCVPTPMTADGKCYLGVVESVIDALRRGVNGVAVDNASGASRVPPIVLRSTVPPGTCRRLGVHHMPEFLTEQRWEYDFRHTDKWIIGVNESNPDHEIFTSRIGSIIRHASRDKIIAGHEIWWASTCETELTKYARNAFLATKVAFFNEIYEYAETLENVRYEWVREMTTVDSRIGPGHSRVPGSDGLRGFSGTCLPKDLCALITDMKEHQITPYVTQAVWDRNTQVDRPNRDWELNKGRSVTTNDNDS